MKIRVELFFILFGGFGLGALFSYLFHNKYLGYGPLLAYIAISLIVGMVHMVRRRREPEVHKGGMR